MNIGYLAKFRWFPPKSGSDIHVYQVASQLLKRGHTLSTLFCNCGSPDVHAYKRRNLFKFLKKIDILYIRTNEALKTDKFTLLKILKPFSLPVVWEVNTPLEENLTLGKSFGYVKHLNKKRVLLAKLVDAAICNSQELKEYATQNLGIRNSHVVPLGSDRELFSPEKKQDSIYREYKDYFKIIWAGSPQYSWQGIDVIFEAAKKLYNIDREVIFILIGKKKYFNIPDFHTKNIIVLDYIQYFDLPPYIASADAGLCLYHDQGLSIKFYRSPLKLFDYMACGLPVIATKIGQISKVIKNGQNGVLVNDNNIDEIIRNIRFLKGDPNTAKKIGKEARKDVWDYYNWERVAAETEKILEDLI